MEKTLQTAINKAKAYGLPMIVYIDTELDKPYFCSVGVFNPRYSEAIYIVLSDGTYEKLGTANVHR